LYLPLMDILPLVLEEMAKLSAQFPIDNPWPAFDEIRIEHASRADGPAAGLTFRVDERTFMISMRRTVVNSLDEFRAEHAQPAAFAVFIYFSQERLMKSPRQILTELRHRSSQPDECRE